MVAVPLCVVAVALPRPDGAFAEVLLVIFQQEVSGIDTDGRTLVHRRGDIELVKACPYTLPFVCAFNSRVCGCEVNHPVVESLQVVPGLAVHIPHHHDLCIGLAGKNAVSYVLYGLFGTLSFPFGGLLPATHGWEVADHQVECVAFGQLSGGIENVAGAVVLQTDGTGTAVEHTEAQRVVQEGNIYPPLVGAFIVDVPVGMVRHCAQQAVKARFVLHFAQSHEQGYVPLACLTDDPCYPGGLVAKPPVCPAVLAGGQEVVVVFEGVVLRVEEVLHVVGDDTVLCVGRMARQQEQQADRTFHNGTDRILIMHGNHPSMAMALRRAAMRASMSSLLLYNAMEALTVPGICR